MPRPDTYEEWLASAEAAIEELGGSLNMQIAKTLLTVDELRRWKRATGREVTGKIRSQLAVKAAKRHHHSPWIAVTVADVLWLRQNPPTASE
ncbi:hypothetical protein BRAS3843_1010007 [Bradyrhizobium sp. STM 3843]|nr:hypothetical protein BRAS3843_1010007 [Bradyrhizobium sp. STM 3843]